MANYHANCRTNYFKVKDDEAFLAAMLEIPGIEVEQNNDDGFVILGNDADGAGWPTYSYDEEDDNETEIDLPLIVSEHLIDGEVAIFMESGAEKLRYIIGFAEAINSKGERESVSIRDIYSKARKLTDRPMDVTPAEY